MKREIAVLVLILSVPAIFIACNTRADDPKPADAAESVVGQEMPFHVADFVNGKHKGHGGCPAVMISNSRGRGLIIWDRGAHEQAFELAKALDAAAVEGEKFQRYLVAFGEEDDAFATQAADLSHVVAGLARSAVSTAFDGKGVDPESKVLVFLLDRKMIKAAWGLTAADVTDERVKEVVAAATKFAKGDE